MKKFLLVILMLVIGFPGLVVFSEEDNEKTVSEETTGIATEEKVDSEQSEKEETQSVASMWEDIPLYPGAVLKTKIVKRDHPQYEKMAIRKYETGDSPKKVNSFYENRMPEDGWESHGDYIVEKNYHSNWGKNDKNIMVWIEAKESRSGGNTEIEIIRGEGKKEASMR